MPQRQTAEQIFVQARKCQVQGRTIDPDKCRREDGWGAGEGIMWSDLKKKGEEEEDGGGEAGVSNRPDRHFIYANKVQTAVFVQSLIYSSGWLDATSLNDFHKSNYGIII